MSNETLPAIPKIRPLWNKGRIVGQKRPLLAKHLWSIPVRLEMANNAHDLAHFNLAIDSKLPGNDLVGRKVNDICAAGRVKEHASVSQKQNNQTCQV